MKRTETRQIHIGNVAIGGGAPVSVQTMGNVPTADIPAVLNQIARAAELGCDLFRVAVPDQQAAEALKTLCAKSCLPLIADIHFDYRLALAAVEAGISALRINPGISVMLIVSRRSLRRFVHERFRFVSASMGVL